jgi:hypothetical protein
MAKVCGLNASAIIIAGTRRIYDIETGRHAQALKAAAKKTAGGDEATADRRKLPERNRG